jgi:hypothetical protein
MLKEFVESNIKHNITGLLLYLDGSIIQYFEGKEDNVLSLNENIKKDLTHSSYIKLLEERVPHRNFKEWRMKFVNCNDNALYKAAFLEFLDSEDVSKDSKIIRIFKLFTVVNNLEPLIIV